VATVHIVDAGDDPSRAGVWLLRDDAGRIRVATTPDPCWEAVNGQTMHIECVDDATASGGIRVLHMTCPEPGLHHPLAEVGAEITVVGRLVLCTESQGRGRDWQWTELVSTKDAVRFVLFNRGDIPAELGAMVEVVGRPVTLSPFVAHMTGPRLCVLHARVLEG
jgi:hypothetical protein